MIPKEPCVQVSLKPIVRMKWPDGREAALSADDVSQLLSTLIIEGLLLVEIPGSIRALSELEIELACDEEGRWLLRESKPHRLKPLIV